MSGATLSARGEMPSSNTAHLGDSASPCVAFRFRNPADDTNRSSVPPFRLVAELYCAWLESDKRTALHDAGNLRTKLFGVLFEATPEVSPRVYAQVG